MDLTAGTDGNERPARRPAGRVLPRVEAAAGRLAVRRLLSREDPSAAGDCLGDQMITALGAGRRPSARSPSPKGDHGTRQRPDERNHAKAEARSTWWSASACIGKVR